MRPVRSVAAAAAISIAIAGTAAPAAAEPPEPPPGPIASPAPALGSSSGAPATAEPVSGQDDTPADAEPKLPAEEAERRAAKQAIAEQVITGNAELQQRGNSQAVEVAPGDWVEYGTETTAQLFTMLFEYGGDGPAHNEIPDPGPDDNSMHWVDDFTPEHFKDIFFDDSEGAVSFKNYYQELSSGRFDVEGDVTDWITLPGAGDDYWSELDRIITDGGNVWYDEQIAAGKTPEEITDYLSRFDVWDRNDYDGDGNFDEPDGYFDHFQAVHAGIGQESGGPNWSIWSHRGWAGWNSGGGPEWNRDGGVRIGDTDLWVKDYTVEPENGGLGVFAHEFGHDLGLPDFYDLTGGENSTAFWTAMSQGSWLGLGEGDIGTAPGFWGAQEKLQLGWLDYLSVDEGEQTTIDLGPSYHATGRPQAVVVNLPPGVSEAIEVGPPIEGSTYLYSDRGDGLDNSVTSPAFTVPESAQLTAKTAYDIESDYDYAYVEASVDGGPFDSVETSLSTDEDPHGLNLGHGITGSSGEGGDAWADLTADLGAFSGKSVQLRFRYATDGGTSNLGFKVDDIRVGDALAAGFEGGATDWVLDGFTAVEDGQIFDTYEQFYIVENRTYDSYDRTLEVGPYEFTKTITNPGHVDRFPYQDGLLVWYYNGSQSDNNVNQHPGKGRVLPVDAHPNAPTWSDGTLARNRTAAYDATFGLQDTDALTLVGESAEGERTLSIPSQPAQPYFDDSDPDAYYDASSPNASVQVAGTGTTIEVLAEHPDEDSVTIQVNGFPEWDPTAVYEAGDRVSYGGETWTASWYTVGQAPGDDPYGPWQQHAYADPKTGLAEWTSTASYESGDSVAYEGKTYQAQWSNRNEQPGQPYGPWQEIAEPDPETGIAPWAPTTIYTEGDVVSFEGVVYRAKWWTRGIEPGGEYGPWEAID